MFCETEPILMPASLSSVTIPRKLSIVPLMPSTIEANSPDAAASISLVRVPSPTSTMTSLISPIIVPSLSTIPLMVLFSSCISPFASTVIFCERSPFARALATMAMSLTCDVRLTAMALTLSVKSFQIPATPFTTAWPPNFPSMPTSLATRVTSAAKALS